MVSYPIILSYPNKIGKSPWQYDDFTVTTSTTTRGHQDFPASPDSRDELFEKLTTNFFASPKCDVCNMILYLVGGWPTPLKNDGVKVSWDDDIPNWMESHKFHVPNHQPDMYSGVSSSPFLRKSLGFSRCVSHWHPPFMYKVFNCHVWFPEGIFIKMPYTYIWCI
jgi:hypothetical protein